MAPDPSQYPSHLQEEQYQYHHRQYPANNPGTSRRDRQGFSESTASLVTSELANMEDAQRGFRGRQGQDTQNSSQQHAQSAVSMLDLAANDQAGQVKMKGAPRVYETAFGPFMWRDLRKRRFWKYYVGIITLGVLIGCLAHWHDAIIQWFQPVAIKIRDLTAGWLIFVGVLFVISFPPLFGHEIIALLCGVIYSIWPAFGVVALGTMLGEWGNFTVFKYACTARAKRMEEQEVNFACIARVVREGGFLIAIVARLSAIPGHLTTPAFAATGMSIWVFTITAILTMPKQLMAVYLGTIFGQEKPPGITPEKLVEWSILGVSFLITILAAWYIYHKMGKVRPIVIAEMEEKKATAEALLNGMHPKAYGELQGSQKGQQPHQQLYERPGTFVSSPQYRQSKSLTQQWPFPGNRRSGAEETQGEALASPLVYDNPPPAGYGYGQYPLRQQSPSFDPQSDKTPQYDSSMDSDLEYDAVDAGNEDSYYYTQQENSQKNDSAQYQEPPQKARQPMATMLDSRSQVRRMPSPVRAPRSQQGDQSFAQAHYKEHVQRPVRTVSNVYYHSNPPSHNSRRYHTGPEQITAHSGRNEDRTPLAGLADHQPMQPHETYPPSTAPIRYQTRYDNRRHNEQNSNLDVPNMHSSSIDTYNQYPQGPDAPSIYVHSPV